MTGGGRNDGVGQLDTMLATGSELPDEAQLVAGRYRIVALAGRGAMGSVYRAEDTELGEEVAVKFLRNDLPGAEAMLERFRREVSLARRIAHPNVARVFDIGEHSGKKFLTMAFIEGQSLHAVLEGRLPLSVGQTASYLLPICRGLQAAHAAGVVHRDLKPDNVMVASDGTVIITDFGIARAVASDATMGSVVGTPSYMAPEQVEGRSDVDHRADLYAAGVLMFEMLTGHRPFEGVSPVMVAAARLSQPPPDPRVHRSDLPAAVAEIVLRCMARAPADRFADAAELLAALEGISSESAVAPIPAPTPAEPRNDLATSAGERTVAVLPFRNAGGPDDAFLAEGLTEDLIDTLSMTRGLRVRPHGASRRFAEGDHDIRRIGEELDVQVLVEGSVRRRGEVLRIVARLVSVTEGFQLWAKRFDRPAGDTLAVSDEVATAVAEAVAVRPADQHRPGSLDPVAVELYLRGRADLRAMNFQRVEQAVSALRDAHQRAPAEASILAAYARAEARLMFFRDEAEHAQHVLDLARRAVAMAPDQGEAVLALAQAHFARADYPEAADALMRALRLSPQLAEAYELLGTLRLEVGPLAAGIEAMNRALLLEPRLQGPDFGLVRAAALTGDPEPARALLADSGRASLPARLSLWVRLSTWADNPGEWLDLLPPVGPEELREVPFAAGARRVIETRRIDPELDRLARAAARSPRSPRFRALIGQVGAELHSVYGEVESALEFIEQSVDAGLLDLLWLERCPALNALRNHPRYLAALDRVTVRAQRVRDVLDRG